MNAIAFRAAAELAELIRAGEITSLELTDLYIARIEEHDTALNAVVARDFDRAREAAREADRKLAAGEVAGPLHGVPMTIMSEIKTGSTSRCGRRRSR